MADLSHWDFAESFAAHEAAHLILGVNPSPPYLRSETKKMAVVLCRLSRDYTTAGGVLLRALLAPEPCPEIALQPCLRSEEMEAAFIAARRTAQEWDKELAEIDFDEWLAGAGNRFTHQTFSRAELARWLKVIGLKSKYQFERQEPEASQPTQQEGQDSGTDNSALQAAAMPVEKALGTRERDTLLAIIAALCHEAKIDYKKPAKAANLIVSAAASMGVSIGETTIEGHLKKIPDALRTRVK